MEELNGPLTERNNSNLGAVFDISEFEPIE